MVWAAAGASSSLADVGRGRLLGQARPEASRLEARGAASGPRRKAPRRSARRTARTVSADEVRVADFTGEQRLLLLDSWIRSNLSATDSAALVGVTPTTSYGWRKRFEAQGPAALLGHRKGTSGSRLPEPTRRSILMTKDAHPDWGQDRLHDMLLRTGGLSASPSAIQRVLVEAGYEVEEAATRPHPPHVRRFERARPNSMWQTDLFTFTLKRQNRRLHLAAFMDDFSRFIVGFGLHASASGALVREAFEKRVADNAKDLALHGEPFFGQDRFNQLFWRLRQNGLTVRKVPREPIVARSLRWPDGFGA